MNNIDIQTLSTLADLASLLNVIPMLSIAVFVTVQIYCWYHLIRKALAPVAAPVAEPSFTVPPAVPAPIVEVPEIVVLQTPVSERRSRLFTPMTLQNVTDLYIAEDEASMPISEQIAIEAATLAANSPRFTHRLFAA